MSAHVEIRVCEQCGNTIPVEYADSDRYCPECAEGEKWLTCGSLLYETIKFSRTGIHYNFIGCHECDGENQT